MSNTNIPPAQVLPPGSYYTWPFCVRHYELGRTGTARPEVYLNWLQEAGVLASAFAGYPLERYARLGAFWWVRRFYTEWLQPVTFGEQLEATTWISEFRRIRANREYEIRRTDSGELVFCAQGDWVFVDVYTGVPTRIPDEMLTAFPPYPRTASGPFTWDLPEPISTHPLFTSRHVVGYLELDTMGHVNNATYVVWLLGNLMEAVEASCGVKLDIFPERLDIEYLHPAQEAMELIIGSRTLAYDGHHGYWDHEIRAAADGTLIVRARSACRLASAAGGPAVFDRLSCGGSFPHAGCFPPETGTR